MTTLAVRFDEELSVCHAVASDSLLPCPKGTLKAEPNPWALDNRNGTPRRIVPCSLSYGHLGECSLKTRAEAWTTVCGLSLDDLPFVPSPGGMKPCTQCFDGDEINYVEEAMFA